MSLKKFIDRIPELTSIRKDIQSKFFQFIVLYGRRRIGKTFLVSQLLKEFNAIYYLSQTENNLGLFIEEVAKKFPEIKNIKPDFESILPFLKDKVDLVILDEFQNLIKENENILSKFNVIIEKYFYEQKSRLKLLILGSSISLMKSKVLDSSQPLFGRTTRVIELGPISFNYLNDFFPHASVEELIEIYGFTGGSPFYLNKIPRDTPFWEWLAQEIADPHSFLLQEITLIFEIEFTSPAHYRNIIRAIAIGKTKLNEIATSTGISPTTLPAYLQNLINIGFIIRRYPITENHENPKLGRYYIADNFLDFWFTFIYPNLSALTIGTMDISLIRERYSDYLGFVFEDVVKQLMIALNGIQWTFTRIGPYWGKYLSKQTEGPRSIDFEFDLLTDADKSPIAYIVECKWSEAIDPYDYIPKLIEKSKFIKYTNKSIQKEYTFLLFAKSFTRQPPRIQKKPVQYYNLAKISELIKLIR